MRSAIVNGRRLAQASANVVKRTSKVNVAGNCAVSTLQVRHFSENPEYAFEMATSSVRFGRGVSKEVGDDLLGMGIRKGVCLVTDKTLASLPPVQVVSDSLKKAGIEFEIFDDVQVRFLLFSRKLAKF